MGDMCEIGVGRGHLDTLGLPWKLHPTAPGQPQAEKEGSGSGGGQEGKLTSSEGV